MRPVFSKFICLEEHFQVRMNRSVSAVTGETVEFVDALDEQLLYKNIEQLKCAFL